MTLPSDIMKAFDVGARHLRDDDIARFIDNTLVSGERRRVQDHLDACAACRAQTALVREAVEADLANPARLNAAAGLAKSAQPAGRPIVVVSNDPGGVVDLARAAARRAGEWVGSLSAWTPKLATGDTPLAGGASPQAVRYAGVQTPLDGLFAKAVLKRDLAWARGSLSLAAAYDEAGGIRSVRASIDTHSPDRTGASIILTIGDSADGQIVLKLTQDHPSDVRAAPPLSGPLEDLTVAVTLGEME